MMMIDLDSIKPPIKELAEKYHLLLVALFGSRATGKVHSQSDFDLAFLAEISMSPMAIAKMELEFSERFKIKKLEMTSLNGAPPLLLAQVARKSILLYEQAPSLFSGFKIYALKRFMEAKKLFDLRERSLKKFLQKV